MKLLLAALLALLLAACAATGGTTTPPQALYQIQGNYNAALTIAVTYKKLPPCVSGGSPICSSPDVVKKLQQADDVAYPALQAAVATARTPGAGANANTAIVAAQEAVAALTTITATLQVKP